jgi:hypothetical protein
MNETGNNPESEPEKQELTPEELAEVSGGSPHPAFEPPDPC